MSATQDEHLEQMMAEQLAARAAAERVAAGAPRTGASTPIGGHTTNWRTLTDCDAAAKWARLRDWVEWFTVRYTVPVSTVPVCWWQHGALVEELAALHTAHDVAFDPADSGLGPIGWHERLALAIPRLTRAYGGGCNNGHKPTKPRSWSEVTDEQEWDAWTKTAHAHDTHTGVTTRKEAL